MCSAVRTSFVVHFEHVIKWKGKDTNKDDKEQAKDMLMRCYTHVITLQETNVFDNRLKWTMCTQVVCTFVHNVAGRIGKNENSTK